MSSVSPIYKHISIYRIIMNILYTGGYRARFDFIKKFIHSHQISSVLELCFGDIDIATYCRKSDVKWIGYDINRHFVKLASTQGFDAHCGDISAADFIFPKSDLCIMAGSLYHFAPSELEPLFTKIFQSADQFLISEPVMNLSDRPGLIGYLAKRSANVGKGYEAFRYDEAKLTMNLKMISSNLNLNYEKLGTFKKDLVVLVSKKKSAIKADYSEDLFSDR